MTPEEVEKALVAVIQDIQQNSGLECPPLGGAVVPAKEVPQFDSKVWIAATTILATKIAAEISNKVNIFVDKDTKVALSIAQVASLVCKVAKPTSQAEKVA